MAQVGTTAGISPRELSPTLAQFYLVPYNSDDSGFDTDIGEKAFQYWPETLTDSKGSDWAEKQIPGLSSPLYQWTQGGARRITFTAHFSRDSEPDPNVNIPVDPTEEHLHDVDIRSAVQWLRFFEYPLYEEGDRRVLPPPKVMLVAPNSRLGGNVDEVNCVMTMCDVNYMQWFPSGIPRIVEVSLEFLEIIQIGGRILPFSRKTFIERAQQYTIKPEILGTLSPTASESLGFAPL